MSPAWALSVHAIDGDPRQPRGASQTFALPNNFAPGYEACSLMGEIARSAGAEFVALSRRRLQITAEAHLGAARTLLANRLYGPAYYLAGLAVECAIKACIARQVQRYTFPNKPLAEQSWVHDLRKLLSTAELWSEFETSMRASAVLRANWRVIKGWKVDSRYKSANETTARDMLRAAAEQPAGVFLWVQARW